VSWRTLSADPDRRRDVPFAIPDLDGWHRPLRAQSPRCRVASDPASLAFYLRMRTDGHAP
jgi:hypothetical protein